VFLDTVGREVVVRRPVQFDERGWPSQKGDKRFEIKQDQVRWLHLRQAAGAT
jgi:pyruvate kinase